MPLPQLPPADGPSGPLWSADVPHSVNIYFRQMIMNRGWMQKLMVNLIVQFKNAAVAEGIPSDYALEREEQLATLLAKMNFNPPAAPAPVQASSQPKRKGAKASA